MLSVTAAIVGATGNARAQPVSRACAEMTSVAIPASAIGLPTRGTRITDAVTVSPSGSGFRTVGSYCSIKAEIVPLDPAAPPIRLEVNLPDAWNGKALMYGGGGFNGSMLSSPGTIRLQPANVAVPLGRGYVTFSSDSGHQGASTDGTFALNDEALRNYAYDAVKKTRDVVGLLISARYGKPADKVYFHGSSNGGKEALGMIQRNPADLDGAIVFWPATNFTQLARQHARIAKALMQPGAYPGVPERHAVLRAAIEACDRLDGASDGVVGNSRQCQSTFDPAQATVGGKPLHCPDGATGDGCLTPAQIAALRLMGTSASLGNGIDYPGFNIWGTDLGSRTDDEISRTITSQGLGTVPPSYPTKPNMPFMQNFADQFFKYFVARDAEASLQDFDPEHPGRWQARLDELAAMADLNDPDLSAFAQHGGKILIVHGMADQIIPVQGTERYYEAMVGRMGADAVSKFLKFYEVPATAHSGNSRSFMPTWDALGALDSWVVDGKPPISPVVTDSYAKPGRTQPLCEYPSWPKYGGTGDVNDAANFACAR
ncbi:MAG: tannase/feruloyl esterase family alpha/beta hydrolase [Janthinobacterium lividum]